MKIGFDNGGQTCNVFWSYVSLIDKAIAENCRFLIPFHDHTVIDYPKLVDCKWLRFPFRNIRMFGGGNLIIKSLNRVGRVLCRVFPGTFVNGYDQRDNLLSNECKRIVRDIFVPAESISAVVEKHFSSVRKNADVIIGIHIRRGDYRQWRGGEFFFEFETFKDVCFRLKRMFPDKSVYFCIASNEELPEDCFSGIDWFQTPGKTPTQDLYALSLCDYVIGPPSSFSKFAAFRGDKPIAFLTNRNQEEFIFRKLADSVTYATGEKV